MAVITISRTLGSGGDEIALGLYQALGYPLFDKRLVIQAAKDAGVTGKEITDFSEDTYKVRSLIERLFLRTPIMPYMGIWPEDLAALYAMEQTIFEEDLLHFTQEAVRAAYQIGNMVIIGRGSQILLKDQPNVLHVRLDAPFETRIQWVIAQLRQTEPEQKLEDRARDILHESDVASAEYIKRFYHVNWADPLLYHLVLNTGKVSIQQAVQLIAKMVLKQPFLEKDPGTIEPSRLG